MKVFFGRQLKGKFQVIPSFVLWGGCLFINGWRRSLMIHLPEWLQNEWAIWGIDPNGDE